MNKRLYRVTAPVLAALLLGLSAVGCKTLSSTEKGAATGAGAGTVIGGVIGNATGSTAKGAIVGAALGGVAGAVIGEQMDKQAEELEEDLEGAEVARVGEGIQITFDNAILFGFDSSTLSEQARENLDNLAESLRNYPGTELLVVGHTDAVGEEAYNQDLSEERAGSAASYLVEQGIPRDRITTIGKGETEPVASNDTEFGQQQNRRVEMAIFASEEYREEVSAAN